MQAIKNSIHRNPAPPSLEAALGILLKSNRPWSSAAFHNSSHPKLPTASSSAVAASLSLPRRRATALYTQLSPCSIQAYILSPFSPRRPISSLGPRVRRYA
ncbi:hypothetical protein M0R45_030698 [Rubus argutus]|uniref:Uncharacterized protein n=1 Tax=Rubus argutus TaxID=59490 RepID=A0AAW1WCB2_RUBAR